MRIRPLLRELDAKGRTLFANGVLERTVPEMSQTAVEPLLREGLVCFTKNLGGRRRRENGGRRGTDPPFAAWVVGMEAFGSESL